LDPDLRLCASIVNFYNRTNSLLCSKTQIFSSTFTYSIVM
jgi:hypothetical protein